MLTYLLKNSDFELFQQKELHLRALEWVYSKSIKVNNRYVLTSFVYNYLRDAIDGRAVRINERMGYSALETVEGVIPWYLDTAVRKLALSIDNKC